MVSSREGEEGAGLLYRSEPSIRLSSSMSCSEGRGRGGLCSPPRNWFMSEVEVTVWPGEVDTRKESNSSRLNQLFS